MNRHILIALASAVLLSGASVAQTASPPPPAPPSDTPARVTETRPTDARPLDNRPADNQIANEVDAQIAMLKARLQLTADQEKNWPGLQSSLHDFGMAQALGRADGNLRRDRRRDGEGRDRQMDRESDIILMRKEADSLAARAKDLRALADAAEPIYGVLDNRQKAKLVQFISRGFIGRR